MDTKKSSTVLQNLVQEAICSLEDTRLASLSVSRIDGSKNKNDAKVYIYAEDFDEQEILKAFKKASSTIVSHAFLSSGWVNFPKLSFFIDKSYDKQKRMEELFNKIKSND